MTRALAVEAGMTAPSLIAARRVAQQAVAAAVAVGTTRPTRARRAVVAGTTAPSLIAARRVAQQGLVAAAVVGTTAPSQTAARRVAQQAVVAAVVGEEQQSGAAGMTRPMRARRVVAAGTTAPNPIAARRVAQRAAAAAAAEGMTRPTRARRAVAAGMGDLARVAHRMMTVSNAGKLRAGASVLPSADHMDQDCLPTQRQVQAPYNQGST